MDTLTTAEKATIDGEDNLALLPGSYSVVSSDDAVATVTSDYPGYNGYWFAVGQSVGVCTITATRIADGAEATLDVEVTEGGSGSGFTIHLGAHSPK